MFNLGRSLAPSGRVTARVFRGGMQMAPLAWRLRNLIAHRIPDMPRMIVARVAAFFGVPVFISRLYIRVLRDGIWTNYGLVSTRVVTDAGVAFLVDAWQNSVELEIMKYHGMGTGTTAESAAQTALITECTTALNPDNTRGTGSLTEGATGNIFRSVGTNTVDASAAVTEHGLFSQAATGGGTLWDRSLFSAVNLVSGDAIQFTYDLTLTSGS